MKYIGNLTPQIYNIDGHAIYGFHSDATPIVRILLSFDAGYFYQHRILTADAANQLFSEGTTIHTAQQLSEFEDFRGIIIEKDKQFYTADVSVYMLRKYADEFLIKD